MGLKSTKIQFAHLIFDKVRQMLIFDAKQVKQAKIKVGFEWKTHCEFLFILDVS